MDPECLEASGTHLESVPPPDWVVSEHKRLDCEMNMLLIASAAAPRLGGGALGREALLLKCVVLYVQSVYGVPEEEEEEEELILQWRREGVET